MTSSAVHFLWLICLLLTVSSQQIIKSCDDDTCLSDQEDNDFPKWIKDHELNEIEHIFIKYNMVELNTLSMHSESFKKFISDKEFVAKYLHLMPVAVSAIQAVSTMNQEYIIVSEEEESVIEQLEKHIVQLSQIENKFNALNIKYKASVDRVKTRKLEEIKRMRKKLNSIFDEINTALRAKKETLFKSLENIEDSLDNGDNDSMKGVDLITNGLEMLHLETRELSEKAKLCRNLIKTVDKTKQRKEDIVSIGKKTNLEYTQIKNELNAKHKAVSNLVDQIINENYFDKVYFEIDNNEYTQLISSINNLGDNTNYDEWNIDLTDKDLVIDDNILTHNGVDWSYRTSFLSNVVVRGRHCWTFKLLHGNDFVIGIWKNERDPVGALRTFPSGRKSYTFSLGCAQLSIHDTDSTVTGCGKYGVSGKSGDTITMLLDLDMLTLSYGINSKNYGIAHKIKPSKYIVVVSGRRHGQSIQFVKYEQL